MRRFRWTIVVCAAAIVLLVIALTPRERLERRLINWYVGWLGGDVFEPVCVLPAYPYPPLRSLPIVDVRLDGRRPIRPILRACRLYRGCVVHISAADFPLDLDAASVIGSIPALSSVGLANCELSDEHLALIGSRAKLNSVSVERNPIDGSGFAKWRHPETLLYLDAQHTKIGEKAIDNLLVLSNLLSLDLSFTKVTDESCRVLARLPKLQYLIVDGTAIGDDGLVCLAASVSLRIISVVDTKISSEGLQRFLSQRPDIMVINVDPFSIAPQPAPTSSDSP